TLEAREHEEGRGLARAGWPEQRQELAGRHVEREIPYYQRSPVVALFDVIEADERRHGSGQGLMAGGDSSSTRRPAQWYAANPPHPRRAERRAPARTSASSQTRSRLPSSNVRPSQMTVCTMSGEP